ATLLRDRPIETDFSAADIASLTTVGHEYGLSAYDAEYLMLAERRGLPLATGDKNLIRAAEAVGVPLVEAA
ncbi:MAG: type II toxin-antitoxin system VapC family toxin, partial [Pseudonocardiaceae bacterium]